MDGAVYAHNIVTDEFRRRYTARFGNDYQIAYAANAYEFARLTADLFGEGGQKPSADAILEAYRSAKPRQGAAGETAPVRDAEGVYFKFPIAVKRIRGEQVEAVGPAPR